MVDNLDGLRARDDLLAIAASWGALKARLRGSSAGLSDGIHTAPGSRPPIVVEVSDTLHAIEQHARFLGRVLLDEVHDFKPSTSTMPQLLVEVAQRYGHFVNTDAEEKTALDFCDIAHELRRKVAGTIARHEPARWAGPCPETECTGELYQRAGTDVAKCRECTRMVGPVEWRALMEAAFEDRLMSWSELVSALHVTAHDVPRETVATWVKRYKTWEKDAEEAREAGRHVRPQPRQCLIPAVKDPDLYRWSDAWELAERRSQRRTA